MLLVQMDMFIKHQNQLNDPSGLFSLQPQQYANGNVAVVYYGGVPRMQSNHINIYCGLCRSSVSFFHLFAMTFFTMGCAFLRPPYI
jgi:hypothetical protein